MHTIQSRMILLLSLLILGTVTREVRAMPAAPVVHGLRQPDGVSFGGRQWGDEFRSGWESEDGYSLLFDAQTSAWTYAELSQGGHLKSSGKLVARDAPTGIAKGLRPLNSRDVSRRVRPFAARSALPAAQAAGAAGAAMALGAPSQISRNIPVILINFSDTTTTYSQEDFASLLFGTGTWSFKDYYEEVSRGAFSVTPGSGGVQGWYSALNGHDYYGQPSGWGPPDKWPGDLVYEAVSQADATLNFSEYDSDGDCLVDVVAVVHQGTAQEASGASGDIWSQSWSLSQTHGYGLGHHGPYTSNDLCRADPSRFMVVDDYILMPETLPASLGSGMTTIGVFAHEYGHVLGLIDLYDTKHPPTSEGIGNWSLMASGSWGKLARLGDRPSHPDPWSKLALGWVEPTRIANSEAGKTLPSVAGSGEVWQFREGSPATGGEYFLLENRQQSGFDAALPGAGMLLWHIDESRSGNSSVWYPGCSSCSSHYKVALVQADNNYDLEHKANRGDGGDPFPGAADRRGMSHLTAPPSRLYNGDPAGFALGAISDAGALMSADITLADGVPPVTTITARPASLSNSSSAAFGFFANESATFECRLDTGSFAPCVSPLTSDGLGDGPHSFSVRATDLSGTLEPNPPAYGWTIDTLPPETSFTATPPAITADRQGSFSFTSSEAGALFACSLDSAPWVGCSSPISVSGVAEGSHTFAVRASDPAGNVDPTPAAYSWSVVRNVLRSLSGQPDSYHVTLAAALDGLTPGSSVLLRARAAEISEMLLLDGCVNVALRGGLAADFSTPVGKTALRGSVTVRCGRLAVNGLSIRPNDANAP